MSAAVETGSVVRKVRAQASRNINGEALVVLTDQRQLHRLNAVGTRVWELCDERSVADIIASIVAEFEVELEQAQRDVCEFLDHLRELGAIELIEAAAAPSSAGPAGGGA